MLFNYLCIEFILNTDVPAPYLYIESKYSGHFNDNGFILLPNKKCKITFTSNEDIDENDFINTLEITSLYDVM